MATAPSPSRPGLDLGQAFRFVLEDPQWVRKMLLGGLFTLLSAVLVGSFFLGGYLLRVVRRVAAGDPRPLPEWEDLGALFGEGVPVVGLYLVHLLAFATLPATVGCALGLVGALFGARPGHAEDMPAAGLALGLTAAYPLLVLAMLVMSVYLPAALARYAVQGQFAAAFEVKENLAWLKRNLGNYALALVVYLLSSLVAQAGIVLCCVGVFVTSFWSACVLAWGIGEVIRQDPGAAPAR